ncbi:MAG: AI-2E family transporter, partial [Actinomycetota bacterium]|nr:AI-2E family transporter [Actinomycetota bacterium]
VESYLVEPLVMEKAVSLHPAAVVVVVTVGGAAFGVLGTILAVPAAVAATILIEELWFERLEDEEGNEGGEHERAGPAG